MRYLPLLLLACFIGCITSCRPVPSTPAPTCSKARVRVAIAEPELDETPERACVLEAKRISKWELSELS